MKNQNIFASPYEIMSDLMMIVLLIFILIIITFVLTVSAKMGEHFINNIHTGGLIRPSLKFTVGEENKFIYLSYLYREDVTLKCEYGILIQNFYNTLPFIDPGEIVFNNNRYSLINLDVKFKNAKYEKVFWERINRIWGHGDPSYYNSVLPTFSPVKRARIYYEIKMKTNQNGKTNYSIIIGNGKADTLEDFNLEDKDNVPECYEIFCPFLYNLSCSLLDFVYLGEYNKEERLNFFKNSGNEESFTYYENHINASKEVSPFENYKGLRDKYIKERMAMNLSPPVYVKENILDLLGATMVLPVTDVPNWCLSRNRKIWFLKSQKK